MLYYHGNMKLLDKRSVGFLSSQTDPFFCDDILSDFIGKISPEEIIITPGHSFIEKQLVKLLIESKRPLIIVLARGIPDHFHSDMQDAIKDQNLLIISPFEKENTQITGYRSMMRNRFILETAHRITIGYVRKNGLLEELLEDKNFQLLMV
ncbi:MAG: hypothetical protein ACRC9Q_02535 [Bacteroidales bacterium]